MIAAGVAGAGSLASGIMGSKATSKAAGQEAAGFNQATQVEQQQFQAGQAELQPYASAGTNALQSLLQTLGIGQGGGGATNPILQMLGLGPPGSSGTGIDPSKFQTSPGYQFAKQTGLEAATNAAAASGGIGGNALKQLDQYGSGVANQGWQQYLTNAMGGFNSLVGDLGGIAGQGQNAATNMANNANRFGAEQGANLTGAADATASGTLGSANALMGGINGAIKDFTSAAMGPGGGGGAGGAGGAGGGGTSPLVTMLQKLFGGGGNADNLAYTAAMNPTSPNAFGPAF